MNCRICNCPSNEFSKAKILNKYEIQYFICNECELIQTEDPFWLEEAYISPINIFDTGIMQRNIYLSEITSILIYVFFDYKNKCVDFAGGYGIFTRIMRDNGFDFYWSDKYTKNLVSRGFEFNFENIIELITLFETFEHFNKPLYQIEEMLKLTDNIFFSTNLIKRPFPKPQDWWYYGLEQGQHITFYSKKSFEIIANKNNLNFYSNGVNLHLLTKKKLPKNIFFILYLLNKFGFINFIKRTLKSKTYSDMELLKQNFYDDLI